VKTVLVTGVAGFIGSAVAEALLSSGYKVCGIDNLNTYYDLALKEGRLNRVKQHPSADNFTFKKLDISDASLVLDLFKEVKPNMVINLAAQAGVRYSISNPDAYVQSNLVGFANILEGCRWLKENADFEHLLYASSSSVYGRNTKTPFAETDEVLQPSSLYAASKRSNELMASSYAHLYKIPATGMRFFTVYGPWGRPDMAPWLFTEAIDKGEKIKVFNNGDMLRDFTYIDDIVEGVVRTLDILPQGEHPHDLFNIGNNQPTNLMDFIQTIETCLGKEAEKEFLPMQKGDVQTTYADTDKLFNAIGWKPNTDLQYGMAQFVQWFKAWQSGKFSNAA
jgi:UDP-glucuronate 4-epimerase